MSQEVLWILPLQKADIGDTQNIIRFMIKTIVMLCIKVHFNLNQTINKIRHIGKCGEV